MPAVSVMMKPSSGMCNMSCAYCFYRDECSKRGREMYGFMTEETLKNIIRKTMANARGTVSFAYQGGEPSLAGLDFFEKAVWYQKRYNRKGLRVFNAFQTNGLEIDENWCRFFAKNHFLVGLSVDGIKSTHDAYRRDSRGNGTYDRVLHTAGLMDWYGVDYNILTVVNRETAGHITEIYQEYRRLGWKYQQYIACIEPIKEERGKQPYSIFPRQYGMFLERLFELWDQDRRKGRAPYIRQFDNYAGILKGYLPESCEQRGVCSVQTAVEADGSVYPCDFYMLDEYRIGNFNEDKFSEIEENRRNSDFIKNSGKLAPECGVCEYYSLCRGGCFRHREPVPGGDYYKNYFCEGYRLFFDQCRERMG